MTRRKREKVGPYERTGLPASGRTRTSAGRLSSITSSARASSGGGTSRPSALAVLRLMTSSNLVGSITGRSAGFAVYVAGSAPVQVNSFRLSMP
jgi:hypothetical protein